MDTAVAPAWADLAIRLLEATAWPGAAALALVLLRRQLQDVLAQLIGRLRRAEFPGGALDFELAAALGSGDGSSAEQRLEDAPRTDSERETERLETHAFRMEALLRTPEPGSVADLKAWLDEASSPSVATWGGYVAVLHRAEDALHFLSGGSWSLYWKVREAVENGALPDEATAWARAVNAAGRRAYNDRDLTRDDAVRTLKLVHRLALALGAVPLPVDSDARPPPNEELAADALDLLD